MSDVVKNEADKIWDEIKDKEISIFALPNQIISDHCRPHPIEPNNLYLIVSATSVLPALESAIGPKYKVSQSYKYIMVSRS